MAQFDSNYDEDVDVDYLDLDEYGREVCQWCSYALEECCCHYFCSCSDIDANDELESTGEQEDTESVLSGVEYGFYLKICDVRERVGRKFDELISKMQERKKLLLGEVDGILANYFSYLKEVEIQKDMREKLQKVIALVNEELQTSQTKAIQEKILNEIESKLKFKDLTEPKMVDFVCDDTQILEEINNLGRFVRTIDYSSKIEPIATVCKQDNGVELSYPWEVAIDSETNNIYVADQCKHCVKVFDISGRYLFKFGDEDNDGRMEFPKGLLITKGEILVSHGNEKITTNHTILDFQLDGTFITKIGRFGIGECEFNCPSALACNESNGDIYICDKRNNRIQVLSEDLSFKTQFGNYTFKSVRDVKLSKSNIYVLDDSAFCVHLYGFDHVLQKSVISKSEGIHFPFCMLVDSSDNILISCSDINSILVFNSKFKLFHTISALSPRRMALDNDGRLVVSSLSPDGWINIF